MLAGIILHILYGVGHIFIHIGTNEPLKYVHDITLSSSYHWIVSHCISHHHFPNTLIDYELSALEPFEYIIRSRKSNSKVIYIYMHVFRFFLSFAESLTKWILILKGEETIRWEYFITVS